MANMPCYLAGPFFNEEQVELIQFIEGLASDRQPIFSPMSDGFVLKPDASMEDRNEIFQSNVDAIQTAGFMLVVIDDFDPGTIWEMGFAYADGLPILAYSDVPGRGLNVMLAGAAKLGFINGRANLKAIFAQLAQGHTIHEMAPRNTWGGQIQ